MLILSDDMGTDSDSSVLGENVGQCICYTFKGEKKGKERGSGCHRESDDLQEQL